MEEPLDNADLKDPTSQETPEIPPDDETAQLEVVAAEAVAEEAEQSEIDEAADEATKAAQEKPYTLVVAFGVVNGAGVLIPDDVTLWASDLTKLKLPVRWLTCTDKNIREVSESVIKDITACVEGSLEKK